MKNYYIPLFAFLSFIGFAQKDEEAVVWSTSINPISEGIFELQFDAIIKEKWYLYSLQEFEDGPLPTEFVFLTDSLAFSIESPMTTSLPLVKYDQIFEIELPYFDKKARFVQRIKILDNSIEQILGEINYQACDDRLCIFRTESFTLSLNDKKITSTLQVTKQDLVQSAALTLDLKNKNYLEKALIDDSDSSSYSGLLLLGFLAGLIALLTPCVFPMIPLTVSFFLKQASSIRNGTFNAFLYGFFIVFIYVLLSLPFHFLDSINPEILNSIATNVPLNIFFFGIFIFFAFSFFGYYELTLPISWGNSTDSSSLLKGGVGIFFMALTLAIVSFSCTGPILGSLLAGSLTSDGGAMQLTVGMTGFGFALALPFALFALFPNALNAIPKSGGWMTTLKVVLGFLELALALKFLSNADLVSHWGILKREVFIGIWVLLSVALTLYLFGLIRFPHDEKEKLSKTRIGIGVLSLLLTAYLSFGLFSKSNTLKLLSGFPPPEFYSIISTDNDCPLGLDCYKDFEIGLEVAKETGKPILLDFTGWACVNCRKMEENIWSRDEVFQILNNEVVLISLYIDDRKSLEESQEFNFKFPNGRVQQINTVGEQWAAFQSLNFNTASQPYYVLMEADGTLLNTPIQYTDAKTYYEWLKLGLKNK